MKYLIRALSPIHIGDREQNLSAMDYVTLGGKCWVISENRLCRALVSHGKIEDFQAFIEKLAVDSTRPASNRQGQGKRFAPAKPLAPRLTGFLTQAKMFDARSLSEISRYSALCPYSPSENFHPLIRDAFDRPYIPGSSIKGALRNAVSYKILKTLPEDKRLAYFDRISKKLSPFEKGERIRKRDIQFFSNDILAELLTDYYLPGGKIGPNTDLFKITKVSDTSSLNRNSAVVEEVKVYSVDSYESPKKWSFYVETIPGGAELSFRLDIDRNALTDFRSENSKSKTGLDMDDILGYVTDPVACAREMTADLIEFEKKFVKQHFGFSGIYDFSSPPDIGLGWGRGFLATSINLLTTDEARRKLLDVIHPEKDRPGAPGPKSRRFIHRGKDLIGSLGWAKMDQCSGN
jgi:CRISPR-associated protein Csm5